MVTSTVGKGSSVMPGKGEEGGVKKGTSDGEAGDVGAVK